MTREKAERVVGGVILLAIFGGLAWSLYPGELLSKPLASLTLRDLLEVLLWLGVIVMGPMWFIVALRQDD